MEAEPLPTYYNAAVSIYTGITYFRKPSDPYIGFEWFYEILEYSRLTRTDFVIIIVCALLWTVLRYLLSKWVFVPFARHVGMLPKNVEKFPESAWKLIYYTGAWSLSVWILLLSGKYDYVQRPLHLWKDWNINEEVPLDITVAYMVQLSFYLHSVYATICMDHWRKDSLVMLFHHFITMALIGFSYGYRLHKVGILILYLHDISDICLEFSKCHIYMKLRNNTYYRLHDHLATIGFLGFSGTWFLFRLYWFPLKALYSAGYGVYAYAPMRVPCFELLNVLLLSLQVLHIYWFMFILNFLYKVATGQMKEVEDVREEDALQQPEDVGKVSGAGEGVSNGVKTNHTKYE